jgi:hypothetical protein
LTIHKTRAKLVVGNLFFLFSIKIKKERGELNKLMNNRLQGIALTAAPQYGLDYFRLYEWLQYWFGTRITIRT